MPNYVTGYTTVRVGSHSVRFPGGMSPQAMHSALQGYYGPGNQQVPDSVSNYGVGPATEPKGEAGNKWQDVANQISRPTGAQTYLYSREGLFAHENDGSVTHVVKA